ncbi:leader peptidase (prepilin peptidase)/N-methyltransferase [Curtobacterium sp. PhB25]|uniref:prepilin peptidase n=1 Tax=unclassified Curtobacterium TaxID=257496 RepID=UPI0010E31A29|nr:MULTISPECIES: A24 family peptidase [unclassified Curtobacterium]TDW49445.1 leader peptidase (prepilin peptidase)/N-methyltransferase [Curtobacterium sp. PhB42]TDW56518.1 leader peptidase (prepilin peptidase)/N-methyltransferase [Curtobacterium sp. PhB190]TDW72643.1 leader peptidase (prepilin peptidase)/N-methyltransferase [Curtobacterium sp. PhB25]
MTALSSVAPFVTVLVGLLGLAIGSFLNVVVYRVPAGMSVVAPASACPGCGHEIRSRDNVPVLSWLLLRARCRDCGVPISARYPLVETATGLLFVAVTIFSALAPWSPLADLDGTRGVVHGVLLLAAFLYLMATSVSLALIDLDTHTLPNRIVLPAYIVLPLLLLAASAVSGDWAAALRGLIGLVVLGFAYLALAVAVPGGMGLGDVKLAGVLGFVLAYLGWGPLAVGSFGAFLLGGTFAIVLLVVRRAGRRSGIPFGPWMLAGAWLGIAVGAPVWDLYLGVLGLA